MRKMTDDHFYYIGPLDGVKERVETDGKKVISK